MIPADAHWMAQAIRLAERGLYTTSPNPRVGCVIVRGEELVGEGWHERAGEPHAEVHALREAGARAQGATAYVTLEPCSHHGRTPPCSEALIKAGVARVVVAMQDPNPLVAGKGLTLLRAAGITVEDGVMETEARALNPGFITRMTNGMPWVRSKIAASVDGRTALANGKSQWITGPEARQDVQRWRARSCAILTGVGTVLADDPRLDVRDIPTPRQPWRVVVDSELRTPPTARLFQRNGVLVYTASPDSQKRKALEAAGALVVRLSDESQKRVDLRALLRDLVQRGCNEVMVEAGATLNGALLQQGLVQEVILYQAPMLLGDGARGMAALGELTELKQACALHWQDIRQVGRDLRVIARIEQE